MKPKRLEFCGINSFSEKAVIDFDGLLAGGIFGIFGDTGSGKTTILDSMIFALYGRVDRVRGGNANEIINYNCDKAYVIFDFECEWNGKRRLFRVERQIKRKNSQQELELCEIEGESVRSVCEGVKKTNEKILEIIGLSFEDFKKCIALPQGEFAQFVKADRGERLRLISRLFDLEGYGDKLNAVLKARYDAAKHVLDVKEGELNAYAPYTDEGLSKLHEELALLSAQKNELDASYAEQQKNFDALKNAYERAQKLIAYRDALKKEEDKKDAFNNKRAALKSLPFARDAVAADEKIKVTQKEITDKRKEKVRLIEKKEKDEALLHKLEKELSDADFENLIADIKAKRKNLEMIAAEAKDLSELKKEREKLAKDYKTASAEKLDGEKRLSIAEENLRVASENLGKYEYTDPSSFLRGNFQSALLQEEYTSSINYFSEKLKVLHESYEKEGALYDAVENEIVSRIGHYRALCDREKTSDASALLEKFKKEQEAFASLKDKAHRAEIEKEKLSSAVKEASGKAERIAERGAEIKKNIDALTEKIEKTLGGEASEDFLSLGMLLEKREKKLIDDRDLLRQKIEELKSSVADTERTIARKDAEIESGEIIVSQDSQLLIKKLAEGRIEDPDRARSILAQYPSENILSKEIEEYDGRVHDITAAIRELTDGKEAVAVDKEQFDAASQAFAALTKQRDDTGRAFAVFQNKVEDFNLKLREKKKLIKERNALADKFDFIEKLRRLFYGNAFMEFVAGEYLSDISRAATETLLKLTNGRYFVRYEQGFLIGDNFSGGELRSVNTLSGGETFLVSLSLALSLSAAIYAKSLRPIEFFFLDEGFGTLDEKLVDTVMDSLEKLKNTHFSIGLISHVEELKHRIDSKITVLSATESGGSSKIKISC